MLLPVMAALYLRRGQVNRLAAGRGSILAAVAEGVLWGLAVWIKPHVVVVGVAAWAAGAAWASARGARWRVGPGGRGRRLRRAGLGSGPRASG